MAATPRPYLEVTKQEDGTTESRQRTNSSGQLGWRLRVRDPRSAKQPESVVWGTEQEAVRALAALERAVAAKVAQDAPASKTMTVLEWAVIWLRDHYAWKVPPSPNGKFEGTRAPFSTWSKAKSILNANLLPYIGDVRMRSVSHRLLMDTIADLTKLDKAGAPTDVPLKGQSKATVAMVARSMFRDAVKSGVLIENPAANLPTKWGDESDRLALIPSLAEVEKLAGAMDAEWPLAHHEEHLYGPNKEGNGDLVRALAYLGPRWSEFVGAKASDVDLRRHVLRVAEVTASESGGRREVRTGGEAGKSIAAKRPLIVLDQVVPVLRRLEARRLAGLAAEEGRAKRRAYRAELAVQAGRSPRALNCAPDDQWTRVVNSEVGGFLSYGLWRRHLDAARALSGVAYSAHELRHVCASLLVAAGTSDLGADIKEVVRRHMGHQSYTTTERVYRHLFLLDQRELASRLSAGVAVVQAAEIVAAEAANAQAEDLKATLSR